MTYLLRTTAIGLAIAAVACASAQARITRIEITKTEPAFGGQSFGAVGAYERESDET